jgi:hypothetical protein
MADVLSGWQPDPYGIHEQRFFSDDGKPTRLVSDGGVKSHDLPPTVTTPHAPHVEPLPPDPLPDPLPVEVPTQEATAPTLMEVTPPRGLNMQGGSEPVLETAVSRPYQQAATQTPVENTPLGDLGVQTAPEPAAAKRPTRARFLCRQCGGRHDQDDGICPRCGISSVTSTGTPAPIQAQETVPEAQPADITLPVAGWYTDPITPNQRRYWNGSAWTEHIA